MDFDDWIQRIRSLDAMTFEDAYYGERPRGADVVPRLIAELHRTSDGFTRGKLSELLGEMGDASALPVLIAELDHPDPRAREWAALALEELAIPEGVIAAKQFRVREFGESP